MTGRPEARLLLLAALLAPLLAGCGGPDINDARIDHRACRSIRLADESGAPIRGVENMAFLPDHDMLLLSAYDRRAVGAAIEAGADILPTGGLYRIALADLAAGRSVAAKLEGPVLRPHGLAVGGGPEGRDIHVIERHYRKDAGEWMLAPQLVEASLPSGASGLVAARITDFPADICAPNDLDWTPAGLFISNDHESCRGLPRLLEDMFALARARVVRFRDGRFSTRLEGLVYANGVAYDDRDDSILVAETRAEAIRILPLDERMPEPEVIALDAAPDSLSFDEQGRLYIAAHPDLFAYAAFRGGWFGRGTAPSRVYRITRAPEGVVEVALVFDDPEGALVSGATGVAARGDLLVISGGYDDRIALCHLAQEDEAP